MKKVLVILLVYLAGLPIWKETLNEAFSQSNQLIDSLQLRLENYRIAKRELGNNVPALYDSIKVNILNELSKVYRGNDPEKAIQLANQSLKLSQQINFKKGIGDAYNGLGLGVKNTGDFLQAIEYFNKSLEVRTQISDSVGMAFCYNNIGGMLFSLGSYPLALQNHLHALKIREENNDIHNIASSFNNIGMIYMMQGEYELALKYYKWALNINRKTGNTLWESANLDNIGVTYTFQHNYSEAIKQFQASLKILELTDDYYELIGTYLNMGDAYKGQKNYPQALINYSNALKLSHKLNDKDGEAISNMSMGTIFVKQRDFEKAELFLNKGLVQSQEIGGLEVTKKCYEALAMMDSIQGNYRKALEHYEKFIIIRDSILNLENINQTRALQLQYETDKKEKQIALLTKQKLLQQIELEKQKSSRNIFIAACILIGLFALIIYNFYRTKRKANAEIESTMNHLRTVQHQLIEQEKLAALGKFTADVAKDIEIPVSYVTKINQSNRTLIKSLSVPINDDDAEAIKVNFIGIINFGKEADSVVKRVLTETRKVQQG